MVLTIRRRIILLFCRKFATSLLAYSTMHWSYRLQTIALQMRNFKVHSNRIGGYTPDTHLHQAPNTRMIRLTTT